MLSSVSAKIKSELSLRVVSIILLSACLLLSGVAFWLAVQSNNSRNLSLRDETFQLEVADTPASQMQGLGGRDILPAKRGMLFAFKDDAVRCFWMKDTKVMLDMIWLDASRKVLYVQPNVDPASYPQKFCAHGRPARYVIELNANVAQTYGVDVGDRLRF